MKKKTLIFLTGTRADFGKIKSLIKITQDSALFDVHIFVTGMHMMSKYGRTIEEIEKSGFHNIYPFMNNDGIDYMDRSLANTISGFSRYITEIRPDLIIVHGDRIEAMAGAITGSLNNILVAHIEGGEVSGTIDELIRHAVSKLSHIHFVCNSQAKSRLIQMGENEKCIFEIGSPDLDIMCSDTLPQLDSVKKHYDIDFEHYAILMFHPVTTEIDKLPMQVKILVDTVLNSNLQYIVVYPNNDLGSDIILNEYKRFDNNKKIKVFPSLRFEYFLVLLKHAQFIIGNSSAGIREAPYYQVPTINIGSRQQNRVDRSVINTIDFDESVILDVINTSVTRSQKKIKVDFGTGNSDKKFYSILQDKAFWTISNQKVFQDLC